MTRAALEHLLRAASAITNEREFVVIGSQAVLGQLPAAPDALLVSIEADLYPRHAPEKADLLDAAIGELSRFHETFGYYAHGVDDTTATLPAGWEQRLVAVRNENTGWATGWCLELYDLASSKLVAGRERDVAFVRVLIEEGLVNIDTLDDRLRDLPVEPSRIEMLHATVRRLVGGAR